MDIRKWLIMKLAGNKLVILNATVLYKYYPVFADITKKPIIEKNQIIKVDTDTPFNIFASNTFEQTDNELKVKSEYIEAYNNAIKEIQDKFDKENTDKIEKHASIHDEESKKDNE